MSYSDLSKKRTAKSNVRERTGKSGEPIDGLSVPATPSSKNRASQKPIPSRMVSMPDYSENPFEINPQLKGFLQAKPMRPSYHFPVRPQRMKHDVTDHETRDR